MKEDKDIKSALDDIFGPDFIEINVDESKNNENKKAEELKEDEYLNNLDEKNSILTNNTYVDDLSLKVKDNVEIENNKSSNEKTDDNSFNDFKKIKTKDNFNKKMILYFAIGFILGIIIIYMIVNYVQNKTYVVNCSSYAEDTGYKYTDEYKITYKKDSILNVDGTYTYTALSDEYKPQVNIIKEDKSHAIINSNGMPGFTYTYEVSDDYFKVNLYLDFTLFDYKKIKEIDQDLMPISYFKISENMTYDSLKKDLEKQGYKCVPSK